MENSWQFLKGSNIELPYDTPLSVTDRSGRQKINKDIVELNSNINQLDPIDMYIMFHPTKAKCTFFPSSHT